MSFGVGSRSFTVIPQGQIETYITARPEEKKQLIDDVAGLAKYKTRRAETERKILLIKDNLEKTKYVQSEIEQQKDLLQEQAKKADEYTNLVNQFTKNAIKI
jgi:chromosome segregation protein